VRAGVRLGFREAAGELLREDLDVWLHKDLFVRAGDSLHAHAAGRDLAPAEVFRQRTEKRLTAGAK
jgi:hypothetical protein